MAVFGVWAWWSGIQSRDLRVLAHPDRTVIVKMGTASRLAVSFDGKPLDKDVSSVLVGVWNAGKESI